MALLRGRRGFGFVVVSVVATMALCLVTWKYSLSPNGTIRLHSLSLKKSFPRPFSDNADCYIEEDIPFITTIREEIMPQQEITRKPLNLYEILASEHDCLPTDDACQHCLQDITGATCETCRMECPCYCKKLCHVSVEKKIVSKRVIVNPPQYVRDPTRIVPRIVHQTWFEDVDQDKYPNMSRLVESFKQSGWEYRFYSDDECRKFLMIHFPPEIAQAYNDLRPGAFKADLFRYCVLLIHGGVYADIDVLLESNLNAVVAADIGFIAPLDVPGWKVEHQMCLWNGFIASAPGHPYLAKVIETVVNNVRNRFTLVDFDNLFCPSPELSVLHRYSPLFVSGPCILGAAVNTVLGRQAQAHFEAGEVLAPWDHSTDKEELLVGVNENSKQHNPGRTVLLEMNKKDMGAFRFTLLEKNLVVAATGMDNDDREHLDGYEHYRTARIKGVLYGAEKVYTDASMAREDIEMVVDGHLTAR